MDGITLSQKNIEFSWLMQVILTIMGVMFFRKYMVSYIKLLFFDSGGVSRHENDISAKEKTEI